ncbi:extracellular solute-binding protein [Kineococcus sp. R8]|nr:extracellular solute-binding protein [Kineococcus siccus]
MVISRRLVGTAGAALAATLVLSSCGSSSGTSDGGGTTEINLWVPAGTATIAPYVQSFNAANPQYEVKLREIAFAQYDTSLGQAFSSGQGPDLAQINGTSMPSFAGKGFLQDVTPIIGSDGDLAADNFYPNLYKAAAYEDEQVTIPIDTGTRVLQYNKKLLEKAGVAPFGETADYADILAAAQKVRALGDDYQGFCYVGGVKEYTINSNMGPFVKQSGGSFVDASGTKATLDTPEAVRGVTFFKDLAATGAESNIVSTSNEACGEGFAAGTVGMQFEGFWSIPAAGTTGPDFELGQTLPMDETVYSSTGGWVLGVPAYVEDDAKKAALKAFVADMYKPANIVKFTGLMPATLSGRDAATTLKDPQYDIYWKILEENADNPIPLSDKLVEQGNLLTSAMQSILQGDETVEAGLAKANTAFQATLGG